MAARFTASWVRDEAALQALGPAWDALEARAQALGHAPQPYASHRYVRLAWQHLRGATDQLAIVTLHDGAHPGAPLRAVWPLVARREQVLGRLPVRVLSPIGIWEGERPGVLHDGEDDDTLGAALWAALLAQRRHWHGLDLRELDPGSWPLRVIAAGQAASGVQVRELPDTFTPWRPLPVHEAAASLPQPEANEANEAHETRALCFSEPAAIAAAFDRLLALDALPAARVDTAGRYLLGQDGARVAFYRAFLAEMAARGQAQIWLLQGRDGQDLAALLRLRAGEGARTTWLERHASEHPAWHEAAPAVDLLLHALAHTPGVGESDLLLPPDTSGRVEALRATTYPQARATRRLRVWNLRSRAALLALAQRLRGQR